MRNNNLIIIFVALILFIIPSISMEVGETGTAISFIDVEDANIVSDVLSSHNNHSSVLSFTNPTVVPNGLKIHLEE